MLSSATSIRPEPERVPAGPPAAPGFRSTRSRTLAYALCTVALLAAGAIIRSAKDVLVPVVLAMLIAYTLNPAVNLFVWLRIRRSIGAAIVLLLFLACSAVILTSMRGQISSLLDGLPRAAEKIREGLQAPPGKAVGTNPLGKVKQAANELEKAAQEVSGAPAVAPETRPLFDTREYLRIGSEAFVIFLSEAIVVFFLVYFLLASGDLYKRKLVKIIGSTLSEKRVTVEILNEIDTQITRYVFLQFVLCIGIGAATGLALWLLGLQQPAVWGLVTGVLNSVPYFGPIASTLGIVLAAFVQFGSMDKVGTILVVVTLITTLDGYFIKPIVFGKASNINQIALFVGLLFWTWLWGIAGMLLAVPIMVVIKTVADKIPVLQPVSELLGD